MKCPNPDCGDAITSVSFMQTVQAVIYAPDDDDPHGPHVDLCSYPELEADVADPYTMAECMDCEHKAKLWNFFPGDINA